MKSEKFRNTSNLSQTTFTVGEVGKIFKIPVSIWIYI